MNNSNTGKAFDLDFLLNVISLYEIYRSRQKEHQSDEFTNNLIHALANEIEQLHRENDKIIEQNEEILKLLRRRF